MNSKESFEILGFDAEYTGDDFESVIQGAYDKKIIELYRQKQAKEITPEAYSESVSLLKKAREVAISSVKEKNEKTITSTATTTKPENPTGAVKAEETTTVQGSKEEKKKSGLGKKIAIATGAVLVLASIGVAGFFIGKNIDELDKNDSYSNKVGFFQSYNDEDKKQDEDEKYTWEYEGVEHENADEVTSDLPQLINYGDITDEREVNARAESLVDELNAAGLYNMATNAPYTTEEIKEVIYYINGAYVPENEDDAFAMVDRYLNLCLAPLNSEEFIYAVNYHGGEDSFKPYVENNKKQLRRVNFVEHLLFGDSLVGPYLQWIEDQYYEMYMTTDREKQVEIYDSVLQSLADFSFGEGFELDGKVYKEGQALGLDKVNSGNMLQFLVYITEPFRTGKSADYYTVVNPYVSANMSENEINVPYLQISEWYTPLCDYETIEFDDEGRLLIDQEAILEAGIEENIQEGYNFATINQMNSINEMVENLYAENEQVKRNTK